MKTEREKIAEVAQSFAPLAALPDLSAPEIDAAIEELRALRMQIHAIDYGSAPGYRKYETPPEGGNDDGIEGERRVQASPV
jgi:hypothetical protein